MPPQPSLSDLLSGRGEKRGGHPAILPPDLRSGRENLAVTPEIIPLPFEMLLLYPQAIISSEGKMFFCSLIALVGQTIEQAPQAMQSRTAPRMGPTSL